MDLVQSTFAWAPSSYRLPRTIWYMGAKARVIPGFLEKVLAEELRPGNTVLDLMCGSGVVSAFCADTYRVLANDVQLYSSEIAGSFIEQEPASKEAFLSSLDFQKDLEAAYLRNRRALKRLYAPALKLEDELLERFAADGGSRCWAAAYRSFVSRPGGLYPCRDGARRDAVYGRAARLLSEEAIAARRRDPSLEPACLVTAYYANVYFGVRQAIELDSLRAALEDLPRRDPFRERRRRHYLSALLHAASVTTSGTSHFAQPRHLDKDSELQAMAKRRRLDIPAVFKEYCEEIAAVVRRTRYRRGNRVFNVDYRQLVNGRGGFQLPSGRAKIHLVYLDPPYTADNYSRFYHALEVIGRYDYPELERNREGEVTRGRYPVIESRFQSDFCRRARVEDEFRRVIEAAAGCGAKLVISYAWPSGLLFKRYAAESASESPLARFENLCRQSYRRVRILRRPMLHSGQGDCNLRIEELLVVCT